MKIRLHVLLLLSLFASHYNAHAMERWAELYTVTKGHFATVLINEDTTISDVKRTLVNTEGISSNVQQKLYARMANPWTLGYGSYNSEELADDAKVTFIMDNYKTDKLTVCLTIPSNQ